MLPVVMSLLGLGHHQVRPESVQRCKNGCNTQAFDTTACATLAAASCLSEGSSFKGLTCKGYRQQPFRLKLLINQNPTF